MALISHSPASALLSAASDGNASIFALFGGQGNGGAYFDKLQSLYDIYNPFVASFVTTLSDEILKPLTSAHAAMPFYTHVMDIMSWLTGAKARPSITYFAGIPIALPLLGLTQLVQYLVVVASGVDDAQWEGPCNKPTGGILTIHSELGEPIHKVATRGVKPWKNFDDAVFMLPKENWASWLAEHRARSHGLVGKRMDRSLRIWET